MNPLVESISEQLSVERVLLFSGFLVALSKCNCFEFSDDLSVLHWQNHVKMNTDVILSKRDILHVNTVDFKNVSGSG